MALRDEVFVSWTPFEASFDVITCLVLACLVLASFHFTERSGWNFYRPTEPLNSNSNILVSSSNSKQSINTTYTIYTTNTMRCDTILYHHTYKVQECLPNSKCTIQDPAPRINMKSRRNLVLRSDRLQLSHSMLN